jgi:predicted 3-demethylubiquinone-9 3-methyltransferase (glyoxalase superfamily)
MTVDFDLGGPQFTFSPAVSFVVHCGTQDEVDACRDGLSAGSRTEQCGWLKGRYRVRMLTRMPDAGRARQGDVP